MNRVAGDRLFAAYVLAAYSGLRRGELLGLRWRDVHFERGTLSSVQTVIWVDYEVLFSQPKTAAGRRSVVLEPGTVELLKNHRLRQVDERADLGLNWPTADDLVFSGIDGAPIHPNGFSDRFDRLVKAAGVRRLTVHGMRHTHATLMLIAGVHPRIVQKRLGHSNISITVQTYSHVLPGLQEEAAGKFAALFGTA